MGICICQSNIAKCTYCVTRKELLVVVYSTKYSKHYISKNRSQLSKMAFEVQKSRGQLARWGLKSRSYFQITIEHRAGNNHKRHLAEYPVAKLKLLKKRVR